jgi:hypothetical protein
VFLAKKKSSIHLSLRPLRESISIAFPIQPGPAVLIKIMVSIIAVSLNTYKVTKIASDMVISLTLKAERLEFVTSVNVLLTLRVDVHIMFVLPATNPNGSDLNARSAARRAKGRKPEVTQASSVLSHWIPAKNMPG